MEKSTQKTSDQLQSFVKRCGKKTPPFFKKLRTVGLIAATMGASLATAPVPLPEVFTSIAGYLLTAGAVMTAVSQTAIVEQDESEEN